MTIEKKKELYESIMKDVSKIMKKYLYENIEPNHFFIGYEKLINYIDSINAELNNDTFIKESLEPDFEQNLNIFLNKTFRKYSNEVIPLVRNTTVRYFQLQVFEGLMKFVDVIFKNPNENEFVEVLSQFMKKRNYNLIMFTLRDNYLHIIYTDNEAVKVNFEDLCYDNNFDGRLYHLTTEKSANLIATNGFELYGRNNIYDISYTPRVYFFPTKLSALEYVGVIRDEHPGEKVVLVSIPMENVLDNVFYYDPLTEASRGIYTEKKITNVSKIKIEEINK